MIIFGLYVCIWMTTNAGYISLGKQKLHYLKSGSGKRVLLAIHGYGSDGQLLLPIADHLKKEFTVYSIDLPHHGNSAWPDSVLLAPSDIDTLVAELKKIHAVDKISIMGYSIGGRVCLKILEQQPASIDALVLIASDGLRFNSFYYFVTRTTAGKSLFRSFLTKPTKYMPLIEMAKKRNWIDTSRYKFAMQYLKEEKDRALLLKVWPALSHLLPDYKKLSKIIAQHHIPVHLFMGRYDKVIPLSLGEQFHKEMGDNITLHIVEKGHRVFDEDTMPQIAACLLA